MSKKRPKVPVAPTKVPTMFGFMCGCVAQGTRSNRVERCDGTDCKYTPARAPGTTTYRA